MAKGGPERYSFWQHQRYLDAFLAQLALTEPVVLVVHDWGSALGFDWLRRFPKRVRGVAYMEAILGVRRWEDMPPPARERFQALRSATGERMILEENLFVEQLLPASILRKLSPEEHEEYRRPFREAGEDRRPTLSFPRQLPIGGEPPDICELVERYVMAEAAAMSELDALVPRARAGDREALEDIVRQLQDPLYRLGLRFLGHPEVARDGRLDPAHLRFAQPSERTSLEALHAFGEIQRVRRSLELYRAQPELRAPQDFAQQLRKMIDQTALSAS